MSRHYFSQEPKVRNEIKLSNLLTGFLTMTRLIWTLSGCVICSQIYWPDFWPWHGWFGLSASAWFALKSTDLISDGDMVDLDSQAVRDLLSNLPTRFLTVIWLIWTQLVRDLLSNLLTQFLTVTWLIWTLSLCVICSQIYWPDFWPWHGWFGLSACAWFALKSTDPISDHDMVGLDSQDVHDLLSNLLTWFLTVTLLIWTLRKCVICSQIYWPDFWRWHGWFGLSACAWFALKSTDLISDGDMVDLDSQQVCDLLSNLLTRFLMVIWLIWTQWVRDLLSNLLTRFLMVTWLIWALRKCVICSQNYWPDFWPWHGWFGLLACAWFALKSTDPISDGDMVDLDSQQVRDWLSNLLNQFLTVTWLIWTLRMCVICSFRKCIVALKPIVIASDLIVADFLSLRTLNQMSVLLFSWTCFLDSHLVLSNFDF